jgi:hypothetical protein
VRDQVKHALHVARDVVDHRLGLAPARGGGAGRTREIGGGDGRGWHDRKTTPRAGVERHKETPRAINRRRACEPS